MNTEEMSKLSWQEAKVILDKNQILMHLCSRLYLVDSNKTHIDGIL